MQLWQWTTILAVFYQAWPVASTSTLLRSRAKLGRKLSSWNLHLDNSAALAFSGKAQDRQTFSVVVWGATLGTRSDTKHNDGLYCILRYGMPKTSWDEKLPGTGRMSNTSAPMAREPTWNLGTLVTGSDQTEVSVRVFSFDEPDVSLPELRGKKLPDETRFLGEISVSIGTLREATRNSVDGKASFKLPGGGHVRLTGVSGGSAPNFALKDYGMSPSAHYEAASAIAGQQAVRVEDLNGAGPMIPGTAPLPLALQGIWWVAGQSTGSSLFSFGGPNNDGSGCSLGYLTGEKNSYKVRAEGDRVSATSSPSGLEKVQEAGDKVYYFEFDSATSPIFGQVYTFFESLGVGLKEKWTEQVMNSQMHLMPDGDLEYPGSLVWLRNTTVWGVNAVRDTKLIQVIDGAGQKIEPAWSKFVAAEKDPDSQDYAGWLFYKSTVPASSPWALAVVEEVVQRLRVHVIFITVSFFVLAAGLFAAFAYGCVGLHRALRRLDVWHRDKRQSLKQAFWIH